MSHKRVLVWDEMAQFLREYMQGIRLTSKARTALALGLSNIAYAVGYRLSLKLRLNSVMWLRAGVPQTPFFLPAQSLNKVPVPTVSSWQKSALLFSYWPMKLLHAPPDWFASPINGKRIIEPNRNWWQIPDFDPNVGDIKLIWELSRFDWVIAFAQRARQGDLAALDQLNEWLADWCTHNPPYKGPNWKCGQEASIRVMHLAVAAMILGQTRSAQLGLCELVRLHLRRIAPTVQYAMAQDNNHGTSEAAALFIGGSWLAALGLTEGERWVRVGRRWLENCAVRLIGPQGSFSQYSLNYHRVMLDTFSMAEVWRHHLGLEAFSAKWQSRAMAATQWLRHMVNPLNGDGPNVGANDGARLMQMADTSYRDHRPSVQFAMVLFAGQRAYAQEGPWDNALQWLGVDLPQEVITPPGSYLADDGGFAMLRRGNAMAMLRYPRFRFRPSQADALHLDLWVGCHNLLRDAGTYSYNTDRQWLNYFWGTVSHNTVQFDGRDQMPRLSRFLLGDWLKSECLHSLQEDAQVTQFAAGYSDSRGAHHYRHLSQEDSSLKVTDKVDGFTTKAVLRWRLMPGDWQLEQSLGGVCLTMKADCCVMLTVSSSVPITRCELVQGWESRHYLERTQLSVLEVEIQQAGTLTTQILWAA